MGGGRHQTEWTVARIFIWIGWTCWKPGTLEGFPRLRSWSQLANINSILVTILIFPIQLYLLSMV